MRLTNLLKEQLEDDNHMRLIIHGEKNTKSHDPEDQFDNLYKLQRISGTVRNAIYYQSSL